MSFESSTHGTTHFAPVQQNYLLTHTPVASIGASCYITSFIPRAFECRVKKNLIVKVERDLKRIDKRRVISMSNSSDPYPPMEAKLKLIRACLELFAREGCRVQVITKS
jgi:DNA repair photolyase